MWFYFKVIYCTSAVESYGNLTKSLDEGATLSMDFQKVFDKVSHRCLSKAETLQYLHMGLINWITSYLHKQTAVCDNT